MSDLDLEMNLDDIQIPFDDSNSGNKFSNFIDSDEEEKHLEAQSLLSEPTAQENFDNVSGVISTSANSKVPLENDNSNTDGSGMGGEKKSTFSFLSHLFDVDTVEVMQRVQNVVVPFGRFKTAMAFATGENNHLGNVSFFHLTFDKPDFYGPFWIATTLIFMICVAENISSYESTTEEEETWHADVMSSTTAITLVYGMLLVVAGTLWAVLETLGLKMESPNKAGQMQSISLSVCICLVGYAFLPYLPGVLLSTYPSNVLKWIVLIVACIYSSLVIILELTPMLVHTRTEAQPYGKLPLVSFVIVGTFFVFSLLLKKRFF
eukprot:g222.t1